jgi:hypothetical protein
VGGLLRLSWSDLAIVITLVLVLLPVSIAQHAPKLSYDLIYPEYRPFGGCYAVGTDYMPCMYGSKHSIIFSSTDRCSFDSANNNYLVGSPWFSFNLQRKQSAVLYFNMYECYYGPDRKSVV